MAQFQVVFLALLEIVPRVHVDHAAFQRLDQIVNSHPHLAALGAELSAKGIDICADLLTVSLQAKNAYVVEVDKTLGAKLAEHFLKGFTAVQNVKVAS